MRKHIKHRKSIEEFRPPIPIMSNIKDIFFDPTKRAVTHNLISLWRLLKAENSGLPLCVGAPMRPPLSCGLRAVQASLGVTGNLGLPMKHFYLAEIDSYASNR